MTTAFDTLFDSFNVNRSDRQTLRQKHGIVDIQTLRKRRDLDDLENISLKTKYMLKLLVQYTGGDDDGSFAENPTIDNLQFKRFLTDKLLYSNIDAGTGTASKRKRRRSNYQASDLDDDEGPWLASHDITTRNRRLNNSISGESSSGKKKQIIRFKDTQKQHNKNRRSWEPQGFLPADEQSTNIVDDGHVGDDTHDIFDPETIDFGGRRFFKGNCYYNKHDEILGIRSFQSDVRALCVLIVKASETFLGNVGVDHLTDFEEAIRESGFYSGGYVQWDQETKSIHLSNLGESCSDPSTIPRLIYEPQQAGSRMDFGYVLEPNEKSSRVGWRHRRPRLIDLCCGAGGMHQGFKDNGFETVGAVDHCREAIATFRENNPECASAAVCMDVKEYLHNNISPSPSVESEGQVECIHASFPCQGFSKANRAGGESDEENNKLTFVILDALKTKRPLMASYENVTGIWSKKGMPYLIPTLIGILRLQYQFRVMVLDSSDYGDPQVRERFFLFMSKSFIPLPKRPKVSHANPRIFSTRGPSDPLPWITTGDVLQGFPLVPCHKQRQPLSPELRQQREVPNDFIQLKQDLPAPTIRASGPHVFHYEQQSQRRISEAESAALMSYPIGYRFCGATMGQRRTQIGNGVPCNLARSVASSFRQVLQFVYKGEIQEQQGKNNEAQGNNNEKDLDVDSIYFYLRL